VQVEILHHVIHAMIIIKLLIRLSMTATLIAVTVHVLMVNIKILQQDYAKIAILIV